MDRVSSTSTNPLAGSPEGRRDNLADVKPQPQPQPRPKTQLRPQLWPQLRPQLQPQSQLQLQPQPQPQPQPRTQPKPGTAADLGRWSFVTELRGAGNSGPKIRTTTMAIQQTAEVKVGQDTTLKVTGRVIGYDAGRNGAGTDYRVAGELTQTLHRTPGATYTARVTAGVNLRQQQRPSFSDNGSIDLALTFNGEWKTGPRTSFFAEVIALQSFAATNQVRGSVRVGATWKPDAGTSVTAYVAGEVRGDQNGSGQTAFMQIAGVNAAVKVGKDVQIGVAVSNTFNGVGSVTTAINNTGFTGSGFVKFDF